MSRISKNSMVPFPSNSGLKVKIEVSLCYQYGHKMASDTYGYFGENVLHIKLR